jgi:Tfp pilus assembly protein PilW
MSLAELMMSMAILTMVAGIVATMAVSVQTASTYARGQGAVSQHARVTFDRIDRLLQDATVSESFPGFAVVSWSDAGSNFPDTLVIWKPSGTAADPTGVPRANELVIIRPDPNNPKRLLEITNRSEPATVTYAATDTTNWRSLVTTLTSRSNATKTELTDLLRKAKPSSGSSSKRGAVRFRASLAPSITELSNYRSGTATWTSLAWPQDLAGRSTGMRSIVCFMELQLDPEETNDSIESAVPFFWSTALWKEVSR